jgi:hypothetical protein
MSVAELKQVNNINSRNRFRIGQPLLVPVKAGAEPNLPDLPATPVSLPRAYKTASSKNAKRNLKPGSKPAAKSAVAKRKPAKRAKVAATPAAKTATASTVVAAQSR